MADYNFKCNKCETIKEISLSMANYDEERKSVICCDVMMGRYFSSDNLTGIRTDSSPMRV